MNRREALVATAAFLGTTIIGSQIFLSGCTRDNNNVADFDDGVLSLLDQIAETILPTTPSSPGAGSAKIGEFMKDIVSECYSPEERTTFFNGLTTLQQAAQNNYGNSFTKLNDLQKSELMVYFDKEARERPESKENKQTHFFDMLNQLTVWGFFSSEPGATKALRYVPIPGRYDGCVPYTPGQTAWVY